MSDKTTEIENPPHPRWTDADIFKSVSLECVKCRWWAGLDRCLAYPQGIPPEIFNGSVSHKDPYPGDNGFQFEMRTSDREA